MKILLLGYGKMGKTIESLALEKGHEIAGNIHIDNTDTLDQFSRDNVDVAIEFSQPDSAVNNIRWCIDHQIPVVVGTTGWLEHKETIDDYCQKNKGAYLYSSNFSIGVNLFFRVNQYLAQIMSRQPEYDVFIKEIHHKQKKDAPSGTAITLAEDLLKYINRKKSWINTPDHQKETLDIVSERTDPVPGTHHVYFHSEIDSIEIKHTAHSRKGFASGALQVAEWIIDQQGVLTMDDFLKI